MASYEIDAGIPAAWVKVTPFGPFKDGVQVAAGFAIKCDRCTRLEMAYRPFVEGHRDWIRSRVEEHNRCPEARAA